MSVRIYEVLEVLDQRSQRTGRYRLATYLLGEEPTGLCSHRHSTPEEAIECPTARGVIDKEFVQRIAGS